MATSFDASVTPAQQSVQLIGFMKWTNSQRKLHRNST